MKESMARKIVSGESGEVKDGMYYRSKKTLAKKKKRERQNRKKGRNAKGKK